MCHCLSILQKLMVSIKVVHPCLPNSETLLTLPSKLVHFSDSEQADILHLIQKYWLLFSDTPFRTTVLKYDIDVGDHAPSKQNAYRANPSKRSIMKKETDYLSDNGLAVPSSSPWCSQCPNQMEPFASVPISEKLIL